MIADSILTACSVLYVSVPVIIFFYGWLNVYVALPVSLIFIAFMLCVYRELKRDFTGINSSPKFWLFMIVLLCTWVLLSGIGGFGYQNYDFVARNPIYHDLCNYDWPVIYKNTGALSYYFTFWLFPAFVSKIFQLTLSGQNICLNLWTSLGVCLTGYNLCRHFRKTSFIIPLILIFFSGLDVIGYLIHCVYSMIYHSAYMSPALKFHEMLLFGHIEVYAWIFSYSSNTSQLYWVFNQSVPVWLITSLLLQLQDSRNHLSLSSLTFAYSPWAAIGIIPIALTASIRRNKNLRNILSCHNILIPLCMLIIYGSFYLISSGGSASRMSSSHFTITDAKSLMAYLLFILLDFGIYFIVMGRVVFRYDFSYTVMFVLLILPLYEFIAGDFIMRASIPALFILMTFLIRYMTWEEAKLRKKLLAAVMIAGAWTGMNEINRSLGYTALNLMNRFEVLPARFTRYLDKLHHEELYSIGDITPDDTENMVKYGQYISVSGYKDSVFFRYIAK